jgi:protein phosphatase 1 regulatory subunit 11
MATRLAEQRRERSAPVAVTVVATESAAIPQGSIILLAESTERTSVTFHEDVIDNEHSNKKKSKVCCIFKKPYDPNVSSDESDSSFEGNDYEKQPKYKKNKHSCNH